MHKRFAIIIALASSAFAQLPVVNLPQQFTNYVTIVRNAEWSTSAAQYIYQPISSDVGTCIYVQNNAAINNRSLTGLTVSQTSDPTLTSVDPFTNPGWKTVSAVPPITFTPVPINQGTGKYFFFPTKASAAIDIVFGGEAGAPAGDKVSVFAVQTSNCGSLPDFGAMGTDVNGIPSPTSVIQCNRNSVFTVNVATTSIVIPAQAGKAIRICAFSTTVKTTVTTSGTYRLFSGNTGNCTVNQVDIWSFDLGVAIGSGIYIGGNNGQLNTLTGVNFGQDSVCFQNADVTAGNVTFTIFWMYTTF